MPKPTKVRKPRANRSAPLREAVVLGRRGGVKGGPARATVLSPAKRSEIARHGANTLWGNPTSYKRAPYYKRKPWVRK